MGYARKTVCWGSGIALAFVGLLAGLLVLLPLVLNTDTVNIRIRAVVGQSVHGRYDFARIDIHLFPSPHATITGNRLIIPGKLAATAASIAIYPRMRLLLIGKVSLAAIRIHSPMLQVEIPTDPLSAQSKPGMSRTDDFDTQVTAALAGAARSGVFDRLNATNGRLILTHDTRPITHLDDLKFELSRATRKIRLTASGRSSWAAEVRGRGDIDFDSKGGDGHSASVRIMLQGRSIDLTALGHMVAAVTGESMSFFHIVHGGNLSEVTVNTTGTSFSDLLKNLRVAGRATAGLVLIPGVDLDLSEVTGTVDYSRGTLSIGQATASIGTTSGRNGRFFIGLSKDPMPIGLTIDLDADLSQLPSVLQKIIRSQPVLSEISHLKGLNGRAKGSLTLAGDLDQLRVAATASDITLSLDYDRLPYPLTLTGGGLTINSGGLVFQNISGHLQHTEFDRISGNLTWRKKPQIEIENARVDADCSEIYPWLKARWGRDSTVIPIDKMSGRIILSDATIRGPLARPRQWQFKATGTLVDLKLSTGTLPGPITLKNGRFSCGPQRIEISETNMALLDAAFQGSAAVGDYTGSQPRFELTSLNGTMGPQATQWFCRRFHIPADYKINTPFTITAAEGAWNRRTGLRLKGGLTWTDELSLTAALTWLDGRFFLEHARIKDALSDAVVRLLYDRSTRRWRFVYSGRLERQSLAKIWSGDRLVMGRMQGDFTVKGEMGDAGLVSADGHLKIEEMLIDDERWGSIHIHAASLSARDTSLEIESSDLDWRQQRLRVAGTADLAPGIIDLNLKLSAVALDADVVEKAFQHATAIAAGPDAVPAAQPTIIRGKIALDVGRLSYDRYRVSPLKANLMIMDKHTVIDVTDANLCGITTAGRIDWTPRGIQLNVFPKADQAPLPSVRDCWTSDQTREHLEGMVSLNGNLISHGLDREELLHHLQGAVKVKIQNGRVVDIGKVGFFTNLLSFLALNNLLTGTAPHFMEKDFPFKSVEAQLNIREGVIDLKEGKLFSDALNMVAEGTIHPFSSKLNLTVLVSPLTTVDTIVRHIPLVGPILQGTLVAVPIGVSGNLADPTIFPLSPKAVGVRLVNILEGILKAPFQLIEPLWHSSSQSDRIPGQDPNGNVIKP